MMADTITFLVIPSNARMKKTNNESAPQIMKNVAINASPNPTHERMVAINSAIIFFMQSSLEITNQLNYFA